MNLQIILEILPAGTQKGQKSDGGRMPGPFEKKMFCMRERGLRRICKAGSSTLTHISDREVLIEGPVNPIGDILFISTD